MKPRLKSLSVVLISATCFVGSVCGVTDPARVCADDVAYRVAMAKAVRDAASRVLPSVVTIEIVGTGGVGQGEVEQDAPTSGVIVDESGFILGSSIVLRRPSATTLVVLPDGTRHAAKVVSRDHHRDLVLLKIATETKLQAIDLGSTPDLRIGATTVAVGRYGTEATPMISRGVLSATERLDGIALQTDARVSASLYGGPLVDLYGNLLGILIPAVAEGGAEDATSWYDSGIAFAIPTDVIAKKIDRLKAGEDIKKGLIGIVPKSRDPYADGTEIAAVRKRSPAEADGIKSGDKVISIDGQPVRRFQEIRQVLGRFDAGEVLRLKVERDGEELEIETTLAESIPPLEPQRLGIIARDQTTDDSGDESEESDEEESTSQVVVDAILPGSPAEGKLEVGDVITHMGQAAIEDTESMRSLMISTEPDETVLLKIVRDEQSSEAEVTPSSIAGRIFKDVPAAWREPTGEEWVANEIKLPDAGNAAAYVGPPADDDSGERLGLLLLLMSPGQDSPLNVLETWTDLSRDAGVVVCAVAPENNRRWQPKEIEVVSKFAAAVLKKAPIDSSAVGVAAAGALDGGKAESADSMALAVAISQSSTFFGVAISPQTRPPAIRMRENEPSTSLQVMFPVETNDELPPWSAAFTNAGYPVIRGGKTDGLTLLRWIRLLQAI